MRRAALVGLLALCLVAPAAPVAADHDGTAAPCAGEIDSPAAGTTVVAVQGARFPEGESPRKTATRYVAFGPRGHVKWKYRPPSGSVWSYDVDPLANGHLFGVTTFRENGVGKTRFVEFDPRAGEAVWTAELNVTDTHDADLLDRHTIAIAHMRGWNETTGRNEDGLLIYNRTSGEIEDRWLFRDHYNRSVGGPYEEDWSHVNDVDRIDEHRYLLSPRNFDQVVVVNVTSGEVELQLGSDGEYEVMKRQHNPQYLTSDAGRPTILVADSDNDRVVEYERRDGDWERTWTVASERFSWPRDADRLPNGNTLVTDSRNNRVVEVTPEGEVVWEVYAPWLTYEATRVRYGNEGGGPTAADQNASGTYDLQGDGLLSTGEQEACADAISEVEQGTVRDVSTATGSSTPATPSPTGTTQPGFALGAALAALTAFAGVRAVR